MSGELHPVGVRVFADEFLHRMLQSLMLLRHTIIAGKFIREHCRIGRNVFVYEVLP